jgi:hypothetical protein
LRNAIIESNPKDPFELIHIIYRIAKTFDQELNTTSAVTHADDLCAWLYGAKTGLIPETRYSVNPDDEEVEALESMIMGFHSHHMKIHYYNILIVTNNYFGLHIIN